MITLQTVQEKDREFLWNINQKYLYEMTNFYDDPMDEQGNTITGTLMNILLIREGRPALYAIKIP